MEQMLGTQSLRYSEACYILSSASVVGKKEGEGPLGELFDMICDDDKFGQENWEKSESQLQKEALTLALGKAGLLKEDLRYLFAGDLLGQNMATSFGLMDFHVPLFGLYGACSTAGESLALASMCVAANFADTVATVTSSHFASAEKQFRFPLEYANQRPLSATWTVTGGGAYIVGRRKSPVRIAGITTGKILDYGIKDSMNMGAAMAPAAADLIAAHFRDFGTGPCDYDAVITGDLGSVGQKILFDLLWEKGYDITQVHWDCGMEIFDSREQNTCAGGSGCGCSATVLSACFLPRLISGDWKRILFVPTGALLSATSFHEGENVPGIAHGVLLEREETFTETKRQCD